MAETEKVIRDSLQEFKRDHFCLRPHLLSHLGVEAEELEERLRASQRDLQELGEVSFNWEDPEALLFPAGTAGIPLRAECLA